MLVRLRLLLLTCPIDVLVFSQSDIPELFREEHDLFMQERNKFLHEHQLLLDQNQSAATQISELKQQISSEQHKLLLERQRLINESSSIQASHLKAEKKTELEKQIISEEQQLKARWRRISVLKDERMIREYALFGIVAAVALLGCVGIAVTKCKKTSQRSPPLLEPLLREGVAEGRWENPDAEGAREKIIQLESALYREQQDKRKLSQEYALLSEEFDSELGGMIKLESGRFGNLGHDFDYVIYDEKEKVPLTPRSTSSSKDSGKVPETTRIIKIMCPGVVHSGISVQIIYSGCIVTIQRQREFSPPDHTINHPGVTWTKKFQFRPSEGLFEFQEDRMELEAGLLVLVFRTFANRHVSFPEHYSMAAFDFEGDWTLRAQQEAEPSNSVDTSSEPGKEDGSPSSLQRTVTPRPGNTDITTPRTGSSSKLGGRTVELEAKLQQRLLAIGDEASGSGKGDDVKDNA